MNTELTPIENAVRHLVDIRARLSREIEGIDLAIQTLSGKPKQRAQEIRIKNKRLFIDPEPGTLTFE